MTTNSSDNNNELDDNTIDKILKEKQEEQEQYIQEQYDKGVFPDYNKKTKSIFNGNAKRTKLISKEEDDKDNNKNTYPINKYSQGIPH